jgi:hypothetical protein
VKAWRSLIVVSALVLTAAVAAVAAPRDRAGTGAAAAAPSGTLKLFGSEDAFMP